MNGAELLQRLQQHQDAVLAIAADAEPLLTVGEGDAAALARSRWTMVRTLLAYQQFKHRAIFDPAARSGHPPSAQRAARLKNACVAIGEDFRSHVTHWAACDVAGEWSRYRPAALAMIARIREHLTREKAEVAALLGVR